MIVTFLGTSHGITEKNAFCSCAVVSVGGAHYIVDVGAPIDTLLQNYGIPFADLRGIFITHPHQDHYVGLAPFTFTMEDFGRFGDVSVPVYAPARDLAPQPGAQPALRGRRPRRKTRPRDRSDRGARRDGSGGLTGRREFFSRFLS